MAEPFDTLLQVQQHDTTLDQLRRRKEALSERAALAELQGQRAELQRSMAEAQGLVDDLAGRQSRLEEHIAASARRRHEIEQRMQSGAVSASRDLQAMDHEVHQLAERQTRLEEEELGLLEEQEPLDTRLATDRARAAALDGETDRLSAAIADAEAELDAAIAAEAAIRDELVPGLPDELARALRGAAVAPGGSRCGEAGRRPVRRVPPDPAIRGGGADPPPPA